MSIASTAVDGGLFLQRMEELAALYIPLKFSDGICVMLQGTTASFKLLLVGLNDQTCFICHFGAPKIKKHFH